MESVSIGSSKIDDATKQKIQKWLDGKIDKDTQDAIKKLIKENKDDELIDSFYKDLEFGTGGA